VYFRPVLFEPTFQKHAKVGCAGCQVHMTDRWSFRAVETGVALLEAFRASDPSAFAWKPPPYEYEFDKMPIDCLAGSSELREQIDAGVPAAAIAASWEPAVSAFLKVRERFLLY